MRNQNGVSLITLVITIIVVIILAAIALGNGVLDLGGRAQFTGYTEKMGQIQADIATAVEDASGAVAQAGLSAKSIEQRRNFVARGGDINKFSGTPENEAKWLTVAEARETITYVDPNEKTSGKIVGGDRVIKVETPNQRGAIVRIYVTPNGNVFGWPPYISDERAYVNSSVVAKTSFDNNVTDFATIDAALAGDACISFANGEKVKISKTGSVAAGSGDSTNPFTLVYTDAATPTVTEYNPIDSRNP